MMAYGKLASSYRRGGMNLSEGSPGELYPTQLTYDEETSLTYELGFKSSWFDRALTLNAAFFFTEYNDFLNTTDNGCPTQCQLIGSDGNGLGFNSDGSRVGADAAGLPISPNSEIPVGFFIDNVGTAEVWGYEVEANYRTRFDYGALLLMNLGYAKGKGKVTHVGSDVALATLEIADDADLPFVRPHQINASFVYRQPLVNLRGIFADVNLVASATYTFEEGGVTNLTNVPSGSAGGRRMLDTVRRLSANVGLNTAKWSLFLRGRNLTNHSYEILSLDSLYLRNQPRFTYLEFAYRF
jgi:outer membrane receptor protein involved in Fe transport